MDTSCRGQTSDKGGGLASEEAVEPIHGRVNALFLNFNFNLILFFAGKEKEKEVNWSVSKKKKKKKSPR